MGLFFHGMPHYGLQFICSSVRVQGRRQSKSGWENRRNQVDEGHKGGYPIPTRGRVRSGKEAVPRPSSLFVIRAEPAGCGR